METRQQKILLWPAQVGKTIMRQDSSILESNMGATRPNKSIIQAEWMGPYNKTL